MCSKYLTNLTGSDVTQQHLSLAFTTRVALRSIDGKGIRYIAKEVGERKNDTGRPKKWNCTSECKVLTVQECKSIVNLKAIFQEHMPSLRQALEDIDSGCIYGYYSIPWEIIAAKHDKLEAASDDGK